MQVKRHPLGRSLGSCGGSPVALCGASRVPHTSQKYLLRLLLVRLAVATHVDSHFLQLRQVQNFVSAMFIIFVEVASKIYAQSHCTMCQ
jgi:hypothetical protein